MIFVRALWGDESVCTYTKTLSDILQRSDRLDDADLCAVGYGAHNAAFLLKQGYKRVLSLPDEPPAEYRQINPHRPTPVSKRRPGTIKNGIMMWWRKLQAIRAVMTNHHVDEVIWLDWDTRVLRRPDEALYALLRAGPPLQSAECPWKKPRAPWRTGSNAKWAFHGGCYYVRGLDLINQAIALHAGEWAQYTDETVMTWLADHELAEQACENTRFYRCRKIKPGTDVSQAYFMEGDVFHWKDVKAHA